MKIANFIIAFLCLVMLISCKKNEESRYGISFNKVRQNVGLRQLNRSWIVARIDTNCISWRNPEIDKIYTGKDSFYCGKVLTFRGDSVIKESDMFLGKNQFKLAEQLVQEYVIYTYYFLPDDGHSSGWSYFAERDPSNGKRGYITKESADSILFSWGIHYP